MVRDLTAAGERGPHLTDRRIHELERTLDSLRGEAEVMHVLLGISSALAEVRTVDETLEKAVRLVAEVLGADRCFAAGIDEATGIFRIHATFGYDKQAREVLESFARSPSGLPLMRMALEDKAPVAVEDAVNHPGISPEEVTSRGFESYIGIPLVRMGEDYGAVGVEFLTRRHFENKDIALARGLARQVGVALTNARRFNLLQSLRGFGLEIARSTLRLDAVTREVAAGAMSLLSADGALVMFADATDRELLVAHSAGIGEEVAAKLGVVDADTISLAGLARGSAYTVTDLDALGIGDIELSSVVAVPILSSVGGTLGAILLCFRGAFSLTRDESDALDLLAAQSAMAIENAQRYERQRRVSRSLQRALLSTDVDRIEGYDFGAVYESATSDADVGGDFFDLFELPDGRVGLAVGDVSGKGAEAAALTARAKYMLRAFAMRDASPSSVLYHLNNALLQGLEEDRFATLIYAVIEPSKGRAHLASAGHPSPMILRARDGRIEDVDLPGTILGSFENQQYPHSTIELDPDDVLLAFTDGLIEARNGPDLYDRDRVVASFVKEAERTPAEDLVRAIYRGASDFGIIGDDTVIFALRRLGT